MPEFAIQVSALTKSYPVWLGLRKRTVLRDVTFRLEPGKAMLLLGPNGSGKSTLLRALAGIEAHDRGDVTILGHKAGSREAAASIGYCPEDAQFPGFATPRMLLLDLGGMSGIHRKELRERVDEMLERMGLKDVARRFVGRLSRGQLRRLSIAQALLHSPRVLLLDEPTSGLDPLGALVLEETLQKSRADGVAVIMSSHVPSDLDRMCDEILAIREGVVVANGPLSELTNIAGRKSWIIEDLPAEAESTIRQTIEANGGRLLSVEPSRRNMLDLFRTWTKRS